MTLIKIIVTTIIYTAKKLQRKSAISVNSKFQNKMSTDNRDFIDNY